MNLEDHLLLTFIQSSTECEKYGGTQENTNIELTESLGRNSLISHAVIAEGHQFIIGLRTSTINQINSP